MFLFTTPPTRETTPATPANPVVSAIRDGAQKTGTGFDYLLKTAQRESSLEPEAQAKTSSATGLFQFIEQTWLAMVKREGPKQGLSSYADAISAGGDGRLTVSDPAAREKILALRKDPQVAAVMAGAFTQQNREQLAASIGRDPNAGELYMAHVLGARGASELIRTVSSDPARSAASVFPEAAAANRSIFFDKAGRTRSVQEVYGVLAASHAGTQVAAATQAAAVVPGSTSQGEPQVAEIAAGLAPNRAKGLIGLFSTEGSRAPVSQTVANLWTTPRTNGTRTASLDAADRYFPRAKIDASPSAATASAPSQASASPVQLTSAPLPPSRPADLGQPLQGQLAAAQPNASTSKPQRRGPLDLSAFMTQRSGT